MKTLLFFSILLQVMIFTTMLRGTVALMDAASCTRPSGGAIEAPRSYSS